MLFGVKLDIELQLIILLAEPFKLRHGLRFCGLELGLNALDLALMLLLELEQLLLINGIRVVGHGAFERLDDAVVRALLVYQLLLRILDLKL